MSDGFDIEQLRQAGPVGGSEDAAYNSYYAAGGCVHLAIAIHSIYPQSTKLAVQWYDDRGRRGIAHAVAYDPLTRLAFDAGGCHDVDSALDAYSDRHDLERDMDADPSVLAEQMDITWQRDAPFDDSGVSEAAAFFEGHFLVPRTPQQWSEQLEQQEWYGAPDPRTDPAAYRAWFDAEALSTHHDYLKLTRPTLGHEDPSSDVSYETSSGLDL